MDSSGAQKDRPPENPAPNAEVSSVGSRVRAADVDDAPRALAGKKIGRYRLLYPIAAGGMAQVWTARPEGGGLARTVAIKLVRPEFAADDEYSRMFIDEAMVASSIHHPNVCEIYELGRDEDVLFMVLEWIAGDSLSGLVQRGAELSPLPDAVGARIAADACAGLHAAHEALGPDGHPLGIVHRDVSPPNILVSMHGHVKVSDFGIAKASHQLHSRTRTGEIKGKFAYIPPEQIMGKGVDRRADIYAMGCVLYVATLGLRPFGGGATALGKIVQGKYRLPSELRADYPEALQAIVVKALSANPDHRYQTAEEMRMALEQWLLTSSNVVMLGDVARIVKERMNPERRKLVEAVMSSSRTLPEALAYQLLAHQQDKTDTPTATSGLIVQPAELRKKKPGPQPLTSTHSGVGPAQAARPAQAAQPAQAARPAQAAQPAQAARPAQAAQSAQAARPVQELSDDEATIIAQPKDVRPSTIQGATPALPQVFASPRERGTGAAENARAPVALGSVPPAPAVRNSGPWLLSSIPPSFRRGTVGGWVFWVLGLAGAIAAAAYGFGQH